MKNLAVVLFVPVLVLVLAAAGAETVFAGDIRKPAVAGQFYPGDKEKLSKALDYYLESARAPVGKRPVALIAPHAGYVYSGQICADAFNQARGHEFDLVVLLGTNHTASGFSKISVYAEGGFETPLGVARIDEAVAKALVEASEDASFLSYVHEREHSIEVLVPFAQRLFPKAGIVPVVVATQDVESCERFGEVLAKVLRSFNDKKPLIVASSDLSHYPSYEDAVRVDKAVLDAVCSFSPENLDKVVKERMNEGVEGLGTCACGQAPVMVAMAAAKLSGAKFAKLISYANSGDAVVGNRDRVVGYGAVAFFQEDPGREDSSEKNPANVEKPGGLLGTETQKLLVSLAGRTIKQYLESETLPLPRDFGPALESRQGAFVTLKKHGELRGCIGHMAEDLPLGHVVSAMAVQAAFNDRRFKPVTLSEFPDLEIEISVLTPFKQVSSYEDIVAGRDGVVVKKDGRSAVFLPQVAVEQGWDRDRMLDQLCLKAGLSEGSWKDGAAFHTFQAQVFGGKSF